MTRSTHGPISVGSSAHNSIASLDGKFVYLGTTTKLTQFDAATGKILQSIEPVGERGVFPYTVKSDNSIAYLYVGGGHDGNNPTNMIEYLPIDLVNEWRLACRRRCHRFLTRHR